MPRILSLTRSPPQAKVPEPAASVLTPQAGSGDGFLSGARQKMDSAQLSWPRSARARYPPGWLRSRDRFQSPPQQSRSDEQADYGTSPGVSEPRNSKRAPGDDHRQVYTSEGWFAPDHSLHRWG